MSFLDLLPQISIPPMNATGADDSRLAQRFADRLKSRLEDMEKELADDEQLEVVAFLPSGKAVVVEAIGYENPALITLRGQEQESGKECTLLVHQASLQVLVSVERLALGRARKLIAFESLGTY
jgi:hypothetical protein